MSLPGEEVARGAARSVARDVDPDLVSVLSMLVALGGGASFYLGRPVVGGLLVAASGFLDLVDGEVAREFGRASEFGDFLDHALDRLGDVGILLGLGLGPLAPLEVALGAAVANLLVAYLGTGAEAVGLERVYGGLARRSNVMGLLVAASLVQVFEGSALRYAVWLVLLLSVVTFLQRFLWVRRELEG